MGGGDIGAGVKGGTLEMCDQIDHGGMVRMMQSEAVACAPAHHPLPPATQYQEDRFMFTLSQLTELLGWASVINIAYLILATLFITFTKSSISSIYIKLFDMDKQALNSKYFDFLSMYKIATLVFIVAPYIALKIMGH